MDERQRRSYVHFGAVLWALTPIGFFFLVIALGPLAWYCLVFAQLSLLLAVSGPKRYIMLVTIGVSQLLAIFAHSASVYSPKFLFCLWLANAGTIFCLRSESARIGKTKAAQAYTTALIFISVFLIGEIILGQVNEYHHRMSDIGYYAYVARFIGLVVFGSGTWVYCIKGASLFSHSVWPTDTVSDEQPLNL